MAKYVNDARLTDEVIEEILNKCGLEIIREKYDEFTGKKMEGNGIMRGEDTIMVGCKNVEMAEFADKIFNRFPRLRMFNTGAYSMGDEVVMFDDFFASRMKINEELEPLDEKLFQEYHSKMCELMGAEYEKDAQAEFARIQEEAKANQEQLNPSKEDEKQQEEAEQGSQMGE